MSSTRAADDAASMANLLGPRGQVPQIGKETGHQEANGVSCYCSAEGSIRYVYAENGTPLAALQLVREVTRGKRRLHATIANVYTEASFRRRGLATKLLACALQDLALVRHSEHLTEDGAAWAAAMQRRFL